MTGSTKYLSFPAYLIQFIEFKTGFGTIGGEWLESRYPIPMSVARPQLLMTVFDPRHRRVRAALFLSLLLLVLASGAAAAAKAVSVVGNFAVEQRSGRMDLVFGFDSSPDYRLFRLTHPERVVLDIQHARLTRGLELKAPARNPLVKRIRYATRKDGMLRVVLDLNDKVKVSDRVARTDRGWELRLGLPVSGKRLDSPKRNRVATRSAKARKPHQSSANTRLRTLVIAIDPGHGGKDPGARGKGGTNEKDVVLKVARALYTLLKKEPGFTPYLTRADDRFLPLRERIRRARARNADLFVSIHADAATNRHATGSSVYVLSQHGASSEAARRLARRENAADLLGGVSLRDKEDTLAHILLDLTQRHTLDVSYDIANSVRDELGRIGNLHGKRVEKAGFVVLKSPDIPSILVETAFISNRSEEKRLRSSKFQKRIARSILRGIKRYFYAHAEPGTVIAALKKREHVIRSGETLSEIASRYKVKVSALRKVNKLSSDRIRIGQKLKIPVTDT